MNTGKKRRNKHVKIPGDHDSALKLKRISSSAGASIQIQNYVLKV